MSFITVHIKFYGGLRRFGDGIDLSIETGSTVKSLKKKLQQELDGDGLVLDSVVANDDAILGEDAVIESDAPLSILPPVCGG
jgi:molybdopterin converting factor small subunit